MTADLDRLVEEIEALPREKSSNWLSAWSKTVFLMMIDQIGHRKGRRPEEELARTIMVDFRQPLQVPTGDLFCVLLAQ